MFTKMYLVLPSKYMVGQYAGGIFFMDEACLKNLFGCRLVPYFGANPKRLNYLFQDHK